MNTDLQNGLIIGSVLQGKAAGFEPQGEIEITENGEYDVAQYATASVNISSPKASINILPEIVASANLTPAATITIREE